MDVFIPIHYACHYLTLAEDKNYCPILCDLPIENPTEESFLYLDTSIDGIDFDLKIGKDGGLALTEQSFHHAKRLYEDTTLTNAEEYTKRGIEIAKSLHFGSAHEYLAAWINETRKQAGLIRDLDMVLSLNILKKLPQWMRHDLFLSLEAESMKQVFAARFKKSDDAPKLPGTIRQAIADNASNKVHDVISNLMKNLSERPLQYDGAGAKFIDESDRFMHEYQSI